MHIALGSGWPWPPVRANPSGSSLGGSDAASTRASGVRAGAAASVPSACSAVDGPGALISPAGVRDRDRCHVTDFGAASVVTAAFQRSAEAWTAGGVQCSSECAKIFIGGISATGVSRSVQELTPRTSHADSAIRHTRKHSCGRQNLDKSRARSIDVLDSGQKSAARLLG